MVGKMIYFKDNHKKILGKTKIITTRFINIYTQMLKEEN